MSGPVVRLRDASIGYGGRPIVHADLAVAPGEVLALVGANGAGKTTLVKGILGLAQLLGGSIEVFGQPVGRLRRRDRLGYVPQRPAPPGPTPTTVREVVASGRLGRARPFLPMRAADRDAIAAAMAAAGIAALAGRQVARLSGGQQRRVLIARALAADPDVLVLDEPLAGVDRGSQQGLADTLAQLVAAGATVLVVLHELGPLEPLVTRVVWLDDGAVVYDGPPGPVAGDLVGLPVDHDLDPVVRPSPLGLQG
jgi:zinc transport system ATP-binding protein